MPEGEPHREEELRHDGVGIAAVRVVVREERQRRADGQEGADEVDEQHAEDGVAPELVERLDATGGGGRFGHDGGPSRFDLIARLLSYVISIFTPVRVKNGDLVPNERLATYGLSLTRLTPFPVRPILRRALGQVSEVGVDSDSGDRSSFARPKVVGHGIDLSFGPMSPPREQGHGCRLPLSHPHRVSPPPDRRCGRSSRSPDCSRGRTTPCSRSSRTSGSTIRNTRTGCSSRSSPRTCSAGRGKRLRSCANPMPVLGCGVAGRRSGDATRRREPAVPPARRGLAAPRAGGVSLAAGGWPLLKRTGPGDRVSRLHGPAALRTGAERRPAAQGRGDGVQHVPAPDARPAGHPRRQPDPDRRGPARRRGRVQRAEDDGDVRRVLGRRGAADAAAPGSRS